MAFGHDQRIREAALHIVSAYINQDTEAERTLPTDVCRALRSLRQSVERFVDAGMSDKRA